MSTLEQAQEHVRQALGRQTAGGLVLVVNRKFRGGEFLDWTLNQVPPRNGRMLHLTPDLETLRRLLAHRQGSMSMNDHVITDTERGTVPQLGGGVNFSTFSNFRRWCEGVPRDAFELIAVDGRVSRTSPELAPHVLALRPFLTLVVLRRRDEASPWAALGEPVNLRGQS